MKFLIAFVATMATLNGLSTLESHKFDSGNHDEYYGDQPTSYFEQDSLAKRFNRKLTYRQYLSYSQRALSLIGGFDSDLHRYDSREDLMNSFERNLSYRDDLSHLRAHVDKREMELFEKQNELTLIENEQNQAKCGQQLAYLIERIQHITTNYTTYINSKELDILDLMDSFGSPESELLMGNSAWFGSYRQCLEAKVTRAADDDGAHPTRYCVASFKPPDSTGLGSDSSLVKMALCLPRSCNSISILRHGDEIELLARLVRLNQIPYSHYKLSNLYCLPDENSPLRQFSLSAKLFILTLSSWLTIVGYFSLKYEYIRMNDLRFMRKTTPQDKWMRALAFRLGWSSLFASPSKPQSKQWENSDEISNQTATKILNPSLVNKTMEQSLRTRNLLLAASNGKQQQACGGGGRDQLVCVINSPSSLQANSPKQLAHGLDNITMAQRGERSMIQAIDLSVMDGIKVVSMIWLIMAHTLLFFIRTIANGRDFWSILRDARYLTVMAGIFPVDTFFTVTGILTAYLKFSKQDPMAKPKYWLEALVHRYLRFMPMYLIVFWFTRDVSEYIGTGPLWDYSTANTGLRSICKRESFTVPLLFQANFKPLEHHCVKPAWYLANDYQFLLVTPLFMMLIMRSVRLGYSVIGFSIFCSLVAQFMTVFHTNEMDDFGALINFKPMFATYVLKNLWQLYVLPYNRIPPYLIGLLTGHFMYTRELTARQASSKVQTSDRASCGGEKASRFPSRPSSDSLSSTNCSDDESQKQSSAHGSTSNIIKPTYTSASPPCDLGDYLCIKVWTPLVCLISIIYFPLLTKLINQEGMPARIGTSSIIALMRFVWSLAVARLIYIAATRLLECDPIKRADCFIVRSLASPLWKPWSKIGLSALLIQWEVIGYLAQTQTSVPDMSMTFLLATMLACIVVTYLLAILIYLTIEYPLSQFEQLYIIPTLFHNK